MCTVTYIPTKDYLYLTSNRDEKNWRTDALAPRVYDLRSGKVMFPKDSQAGGTWIAAHENGNVVVFLNGGFKAHTPRPPYRKSRGLVLLDLIDHTSPCESFDVTDLDGIEPFTAIIRDNGHLYECRWDSEKKYNVVIDASIPHIWSSVTLYDQEVISKRKQWFGEWITNNPGPTMKEILHFHEFTGDGDTNNDLRMNRDGKMLTVSITSVEINDLGLKMDYRDLKNDQRFSGHLAFESSISGG
jgi:hypothetical protein